MGCYQAVLRFPWLLYVVLATAENDSLYDISVNSFVDNTAENDSLYDISAHSFVDNTAENDSLYDILITPLLSILRSLHVSSRYHGLLPSSA